MELIKTPGLVLEPLTVAHAEAMFAVLSDPNLYSYLDYGPPPSLEHIRNVYEKLEARKSPDGSELWLNWVVRLRGEEPIGYVQATIGSPGAAWVAYVLSSTYWGRGYAHMATHAMIEHLALAYDITRYMATVEAGNIRSIRLLERLSFHPGTSEEAKHLELSSTERLFVR